MSSTKKLKRNTARSQPRENKRERKQNMQSIIEPSFSPIESEELEENKMYLMEHVPSASAQEATSHNKTETQYNEPTLVLYKIQRALQIATISIRSSKRPEALIEVETWVRRNGIEILAAQETKQPRNGQIVKKRHTWYFFGNNKTNMEHHGVAIAIASELRNYVKDVIPINERLMIFTFRETINITIISAYAPTAASLDEGKDTFYNVLGNEVRTTKNKGAIYMMGDFNARIQEQITEMETNIGKHTFAKTRSTMHKQSA